MLSPTGRSLAFCRGGDGFVRGEGCGLVLLRRLGDALAAGDRVYGVLRGTCVNQDGRSNGLTAPNGPAQQAVIRGALAASGLSPGDIDYIEAHGTGTELGDPTEMGALAAVFGRGRDEPLRVGTAKTNLGHLEGAAGVAGLIKACLSLYHEQLPPHPLLEPGGEGPTGPSPHIDWTQPIEVPSRLTPWPRRAGRVRRAGVSSFGFGGTNAHAVLEEAPEAPAAGPPVAGPRWLTLSAKTPAALGALARRYAEALPALPSGVELEAIAYAANTGRASHAERLAVAAEGRGQMAAALEGWAAGRPPAAPTRVARGTAPGGSSPEGQSSGQSCGWLFGGQGGCRPGMGRGLYARYEAFRLAWDDCQQTLAGCWPRTLREVCWERPELLRGVDAQVALVAWQVSLAELWKAWAGEPGWVIGHSLGELAAAVTAGVLTRGDALRLVCRRAELLDAIAPEDRGVMLAVMAPAEEVAARLAEQPSDGPSGELVIAAYNGPRQTVVSGPRAAAERFAQCSGLRSRMLATSHAFHSPLVEAAAGPLAEACGGLAVHAPRLGFLSTLTGQPLEGAPAAGYWAEQLRRPVRFAQALVHAPVEGPRIELSPTPVLGPLCNGPLCKGGAEPAAGEAKNPGAKNPEAENPEAEGAEASAARLWAGGLGVDFRAIYPEQPRRVALPTYPFERRRHWFQPGGKPGPSTQSLGPQQARPQQADTLPIHPLPLHPLLGERLDLAAGVAEGIAAGVVVFQADLGQAAWLADHRLQGKPTLPAVACVEMALAAAHHAADQQPERPRYRVEDLRLLRPVQWGPGQPACVQTVLTPVGGGTDANADRQPPASYQAELLHKTPAGWRRTASCRVVAQGAQPAGTSDATTGLAAEAMSTAGLTPQTPAEHYRACAQAGLDYGPAFRAVASLAGKPHAAAATLLPPPDALRNFHLPTTSADAALQTLQAALPKSWNHQWLPKAVLSAEVLSPEQLQGEVTAHVSLAGAIDLSGEAPNELLMDASLLGADGQLAAVLRGVRLAKTAGQNYGDDQLSRYFQPVWRPRIRTRELSAPPPIAAESIGDALRRAAPSITRHAGAERRPELLAELERQGGHYAAAAWATLTGGASLTPGQSFTADELAERLSIAPPRRRLFGRLLEILAEDGQLDRTADGWRAAAAPSTQPGAGATIEGPSGAGPAHSPELDLLRRCGQQLPGVLRGEVDPLTLLFPPDGGGAADLYRNAP
ncbi:MAG: type I polyketide synthase, partial [Planctomycetota bacterium]